MMRSLGRVLVGSLLCAIAACSSPAQTSNGSVAGTVTDQGGAAVPKATITLRNSNTGTTQTVTTSADGFYRVQQLLPGTYSVTVEAPGFKTQQQTNLEVQLGQVAPGDVSLSIGQASETVQVNANTVALQSESSDVSTVLEPQAVHDLPLSVNGLRTPVDFIFLTPGVTGGGPVGNNAIKFAGGQDLGGLILIDGLPINTSTGNNFDSPTYTPSVDAIQEFNVILAGLPAEYGRTSGGIESFVTKSGTNAFHGSGYEFFRNTVLDANSWFNNANRARNCVGSGNTADCRKAYATPADKKNDFGVTLGGPVRIPHLYDGRDKTFFFFSWEQLRITNGGTSSPAVPTVANRNGDFSAQLGGPLFAADGVTPIINPCTGAQLLQGQIFDPATTRTVNGIQCRNPYPNNVITSGISSVAQNVLGFIPAPINSGVRQNYFRTFSAPTTQTAQTIRIDHTFSQHDKIFGSYNPNEQLGSCSFQVFPNYSDPACAHNDFFLHAARFGWDHIFTPTLLNHFTFGGDRENHQVASLAAQSGVDFNAQLGLKGTKGTTFPQFNFGQGYQAPGFGLDLALIDNHFQVYDSVEWVKGKHNLRLGGEYRYLQFSIPNRGGNSGTYNFSTNETAGTNTSQSQTGNSFASFLVGQVSSASVAYQLHAPRSSQFYGAVYAQDDWKVRPNLTLNLGVRYDLEPAPREKQDFKSNFSPTLPNVSASGLPGALYFAGSGAGRSGVGSGFAHTWYKDVAPRVGFSWSPGSLQNKTVVRGSYNIVYSALPISAAIGTPAPGVNPVSPVSTGFNINANYTDSATNFSAPFTLDQGFPAYTLQPNFSPDQANGTPNAAYTAPSYGRPGMLQIWEGEVQQEFPGKVVATFGYIGSHSTHSASNLRFINNLNPRYFSLGTQLLGVAGAGAPAGNPYPAFQSNYGGNGTVAQALRPFPQFLEIGEILENVGQSNYNAGFVRLQRSFTNGFSLLSSYTWSKTLTDADSQFPGIGAGGNAIQDPFNLKGEKSYSTQDLPQLLTISYLYELPFGAKKQFLNHGRILNAAVGGFQVGGIHRYTSGFPTQFACANAIPGTDTCTRYNLVGDPHLRRSGSFNPFTDPIYNRAAFQDPNASVSATVPYRYGNAPRVLGSVRTPVFLDEAFSLIKRTQIHESANLEFRADLFNAFNRHIFGGGDTNPSPTNPNFGLVGGVLDSARQVQFMLRVNF